MFASGPNSQQVSPEKNRNFYPFITPFGTPSAKPSGIPQSASAQAFDTVTSPVPAHAANFAGSKYSEPKNWAPGNGNMSVLPPPRFSLSMPSTPGNMQLVLHHQAAQNSISTVNSDPFFVGSASSSLFGSPQSQVAYPSLGDVGYHRSPELTFLMSGPCGLPFFSVAINPAHFPFTESARQHKGVNYGVVKIRNVRMTSTAAVIINA